MKEWLPECAPQRDGTLIAEWVAGRIETLLSHYFQPEVTPEVAEAAMLDWIAALDGFPQESITAACGRHVSTSRRRPTPADIADGARQWLAQRHPKPLALNPPDPPRAPDVDRSPERAQAILDAAGFTAKRFQSVARAPMATTYAAAEAHVERARVPHWTETAPPDDPKWAELERARAANPLIAAMRAKAARAAE